MINLTNEIYNIKNENKKRWTIGLFIEGTDGIYGGDYQTLIWEGVNDSARDLELNLICFSGGILLESTDIDYIANKNIIYDLAKNNKLDGLIISNSIASYIEKDEFISFCNQFKKMPIVIIGASLPNISNVLVDNKSGMQDAILHLQNDHNRQSIAFIRGPKGSQEAEDRYSTYLEVLGQPTDPHLIFQGDFLSSSGEKAVKDLIDKNVNFDAIIAANDNMALGALKALKQNNISVPEDDYLIIGFDDIEEAYATTPTLTTVYHPMYEQGRCATELLFSLLSQKTEYETIILPTSLIKRGSCDCYRTENSPSIKGNDPVTNKENENRLITIDSIKQEIKKSVHIPQIKEIQKNIEVLVDSFFDAIKRNNHVYFLQALDKIIKNTNENHGDVYRWQNAMLIIRSMFPSVCDNQYNLATVEELCNKACLLVIEIAHRCQRYKRIQLEQQSVFLREISEKLIASININNQMDVLAKELPQLGIPCCYLFLYEQDLKNTDESSIKIPEKSKLVLQYNENIRIIINESDTILDSKNLIPNLFSNRSDRFSFIIEPLFIRSDNLGFSIFEIGPRDGLVYEELRKLIGNGLKASKSNQEIVKRVEELEKLQADVKKLEQDKEIFNQIYTASATAIGIFHTANKIINVTLPLLKDLKNNTKINEDKKLKELVTKITSPIDHLSEFYDGIKCVLQGYEPQFDRFNLWELVTDVISLLRPTIVERSIKIQNLIDKNYYAEIDGDPMFLKIVFMNLFANCIEANSHEILIYANDTELIKSGFKKKGVEVLVEDNGNGIEEEDFEKIFQSFYTKNKEKGSGTGLGLYVNRDILNKHNGDIIVKHSKLGKGTTFSIKWPKNLQ